MIEITAELYNASKKIINWQVHRQHLVHSELDVDELRSQANYLFCMACSSFDPTKSTAFTTHLTNQLLRLGDMADRSHAPSLTKGVEGSLWVSLHQKAEGDDASVELCPSDACEDYGRKMAADEDVRGFKPYASMLSDKALRLYDDILDGTLDANPLRIAKLGWREYSKKCVLTPQLIYSRKYKAEGWSISECKEAFSELSTALKAWASGRLPSRLVKQPSKPRKALFDISLIGA